MLLRNYYTGLTASAIGTNNITEDVSQNLSPRYSRTTNGNYALAFFTSNFIQTNQEFKFIYGIVPTPYSFTIWFGKNTSAVNFNDYAPIADYNVILTSSETKNSTTYDDNLKTYTNVREYTLTNNSDNDLIVNEILIGGSNNVPYGTAYLRELMGDNSFTISAKESVKFELTIKYTIAEPLQ